MKEIMKIIRSVKQSGLLIKDVTQTITNETKKQRNEFLGIILDILGARLLENMLAGKGVVAMRQRKDGVVRAGTGRVVRSGDGVHRAGQDF